MALPNNDEKLPAEELAVLQEPPFDPEDTSPTGVIRRDSLAPATSPVQARRGTSWVNWLLSGAATIIMLLAIVLYIQQSNQPTPEPTQQQAEVIIVATTIPTIQPTMLPTQANAKLVNDTSVPSDVVAELLMQQGDTVPASGLFYRMQTAYTIAPVRPRAGVEEYTIQSGDTLDKIAARYGITTDTLVWNNDGIYVNRLFPGDKLTILPENGILHKTQKEQTIQEIADQYKVSAYAILDSEYNHLQNAKPTTLLPLAHQVIVPGGTSTQKARFWDPGTSFKPAAAVITGGNGVSSNADGEVSFGGGSGSCGYQPNTPGTGTLIVPLPPGYTVIRGFFPGHSGIDLSSRTGTTVFAADAGTVIFAGWSNWGYGNSIVLAHGNKLTLYGHLSRINVRCGQQLSQGAPIGAVGSSGNSSGPHLHFEIRPAGGEPADPVGYMAF
jgi:murein DD-endopeptidase MepM/ murein hydrolase activator NlpD